MAQTHVFRGTARNIVRQNGVTQWIYHNTAVVTQNADKTIRLDSGGWLTATTRRAMNQASNENGLGFRVFQQKGEWFVHWPAYSADHPMPFHDGMILNNIPRGQ